MVHVCIIPQIPPGLAAKECDQLFLKELCWECWEVRSLRAELLVQVGDSIPKFGRVGPQTGNLLAMLAFELTIHTWLIDIDTRHHVKLKR